MDLPSSLAAPAGLDRPVADAQAVFRAALQAFAQPGLMATSPAAPVPPQGLQPSTWALALALFDAETRVLLCGYKDVAEMRRALGQFTECAWADGPADADFVLAASPAALPALTALKHGSDFDPHDSATVVVEVAAFAQGEPVALQGPGVDGQAAVRVTGLDDGFWSQWARVNAAYPRGVDILFSDGRSFLGLPRTARRI